MPLVPRVVSFTPIINVRSGRLFSGITLRDSIVSNRTQLQVRPRFENYRSN